MHISFIHHELQHSLISFTFSPKENNFPSRSYQSLAYNIPGHRSTIAITYPFFDIYSGTPASFHSAISSISSLANTLLVTPTPSSIKSS